jgi:hypothetical protein
MMNINNQSERRLTHFGNQSDTELAKPTVDELVVSAGISEDETEIENNLFEAATVNPSAANESIKEGPADIKGASSEPLQQKSVSRNR